VVSQGSSGVENEELIAYELGYRVRPSDTTSLDIAGFYNDYDNLVTADAGALSTRLDPALHNLQPLVLENGLEGVAFGGEIAGTWQVSDTLRLSASYGYLQVEFDNDSGGSAEIAEALEGVDPEHQGVVRAAWDPAPGWTVDAALRYVDDLPSLRVDDYLGLDLRVGWRPTAGLELALAGRNLLEPSHLEFGGQDLLPATTTLVERSVLFTVTARF
jgi:iron complex outermembrane receptor protein